MNAEMLVDKTFSGKLNEYKDVCRLMRTAFPQNEQIPMWLLRVLAFRKNVNFRAFYEDDQLCGILYTAENALQREKRLSFYSRNGVFDTGCRFVDEGEKYSVLASDIESFDPREYEMLLSKFSFGMYKKHIT